jgi:hypothetical protein
MPKRWEQELRRLGEVQVPTERIQARSTRPSEPGSPMPPTRQRLVAGIVAFGVFTAAALFGWQAFIGGGLPAQPAIARDWPVATVTLSSDGSGKSAVLSIAGRAQRGAFGSSTSPDEDYPYRWSIPAIDRAISVPIGAELRLDGDVWIKEILFGDADELDAGKGPDSGPISSEQPTFEDPYFPVQDQPRREYWKFFGTWADGSVLDVYFEVRWVEPRVDPRDTSVDIVVTPTTLEADLLYGGQRRGTMGEGGYGGMSVTAEWAGYDADTLYFPVAAGSTINVVGDDLESWTARVDPRQGPEPPGTIDRFPDYLGPTTLHLSVVWGGGSGSFRFPIEIVQAPSDAPPGEPSDVLRIRCGEGRTTVLTPIVAAGPDGVEVEVLPPGGEYRVEFHEDGDPSSSFGGSIPPDGETHPWPIAPGSAQVACNDRLQGVEPFKVVDPAGHYAGAELNCDGDAQAEVVGYDGGGAEWIDEAAAIRGILMGVRETDRLVPSLYGRDRLARWSIVRDDSVVGLVTFTSVTGASDPRGSGLGRVDGLVCVASDIDGSVRPRDPDGDGVDLDCAASSQVAFRDRSGVTVFGSAEALMRGVVSGIRATDVLVSPQHPTGPGGDEGVWTVEREGKTVASIDYPELDGITCRWNSIGLDPNEL